ncbi:MAG: hypothetical protein JNK23_09220 [Opitutaceae bacterium]|nr:hypothetical protein [Opitutaceae bacterium]
MKDRLFLLAMLLVAGTALYCGLVQPRVSKIPPHIREAVDDLKPVIPPLALPTLVIPEIPAIELPQMLPKATDKNP